MHLGYDQKLYEQAGNGKLSFIVFFRLLPYIIYRYNEIEL